MALAVAALRNLATKIRIPGPSALMALRAPGPLALAPLPPLPPPPQGDLKSALLLKDKIESAGFKELMFSGDLIAEHCEKTEEMLSQAAKSHAQVARSVRNVALRCFCTGVVLGSIDHMIESYYYIKKEAALAAEVERLELEQAVGQSEL